MSVEIAVASHRALAPYVESGKRIHLPRIWNADDHAKLLLCVGVRSSRLHAAKFERRPLYLSRSGRMVEALTVWVGKRSGSMPRTAPAGSGIGPPSSVTSAHATPLKARTRAM